MLTEFFSRFALPFSPLWQDLLPGVRACRVSICAQTKMETSLSVCRQENETELFFCFSGQMELWRGEKKHWSLTGNCMLLCLPASGERTLVLQGALEGVLLAIQNDAFCFWMKQNREKQETTLAEKAKMQKLMVEQGWLIQPLDWPAAFLDAWSRLSPKEQGLCCLTKGMEICGRIEQKTLAEGTSFALRNACQTRQMAAMAAYLEAHLDEKLTIASLSRRFYMSQTALKTAFRSHFGLPVHCYLQQKRMERAEQALREGEKSILEVAHAVGYESISQFNACFKRFFGVTPTQYRKLSDSGKNGPFPLDETNSPRLS